MEGALLKAFCDVKNGLTPQGLSAANVAKINDFLNWTIYIGDGEIGIMHHTKLAYKKCNTSSLNMTDDYIIYIASGVCYLYIQSHINIPTMIELNKKQTLPIQNTPYPALSVGQYTVNYTHRHFKI
ncbi:MAG TPA: hypothetical protein VLG50_06720 [Candidatus Saccharimonadales bacterium]|nr:hypothetical protein [Candidatus Saccharimonadales bacterium]